MSRQKYQSIPVHQNSIFQISRSESANVTGQQAKFRTDGEYFHNLQHYSPLCYGGSGTPVFLLNNQWYLSLICMFIVNGLFALALFLFIDGANVGRHPLSESQKRLGVVINMLVVLLIDFTYILTQFLNPGIRNLSTISDVEYETDGKYFCRVCHGYRTGQMEHCNYCEVCVQGLDHHCGFFSKCIGGCQKYAFYLFLISILAGFFVMLVTMVTNIGL